MSGRQRQVCVNEQVLGFSHNDEVELLVSVKVRLYSTDLRM